MPASRPQLTDRGRNQEAAGWHRRCKSSPGAWALTAIISVVEVGQGYGIEIGEFPAGAPPRRSGMMDHIMNNRLSLEFGQTNVRVPLEKSPHVCRANALDIDWTDVLSPGAASSRSRAAASGRLRSARPTSGAAESRASPPAPRQARARGTSAYSIAVSFHRVLVHRYPACGIINDQGAQRSPPAPSRARTVRLRNAPQKHAFRAESHG